MSTLRNKSLVRNFRLACVVQENDVGGGGRVNDEDEETLIANHQQENKVSSSSNSNNASDCNFINNSSSSDKDDNGGAKLLVSVKSLKKITKALFIMKENNRKLTQCLRYLSSHYKRQYEVRLQKLRLLLNKKNEKLQKIRKIYNDNSKKCTIILRHNNKLLFCNNCDDLLKNKWYSVVVYKISNNPSVDKLLCESVAKTKYGEKVVVNKKILTFVDIADADSFVKYLKEIFSH
ncbi:orf137 [Artaxa digramma nucleopolyhedrovirus]|uniref:Orf137 n=1 Tax=Artaxa digramma nucleopolyhedrovirus TaxID=3070910 RepID=A0AAE6R796_9ABAC|nr:orf137 [Euproctis digramma nucleopolyhedrovirus]QHB21796.1 orf137 [Artaxa digramma nucleopolyhedrovirus]